MLIQPLQGKTQFNVYNILGQLQLNADTDQGQYHLDIQSLLPGKYFLEIIQGKDQKIVRQIVKK